MRRIAIIGGGIAGVSAAYELALAKRAGTPIEFTLFEATARLGGIVETERRDCFVIECGPDSWVTEKPWARQLAVELGLENQIISSQDDRRRTYIADGHTLQPMPDGMRMMVPIQWTSMLQSSLFSWQAKLAYLREPKIAEQLKATALDSGNPARDESVRDFIVRHFGPEVADILAAPLLTGVFGGEIATLSARAVLPAYIRLEREHGSLILGLQHLQQHRLQAGKQVESVFTTLANGLGGLIDGMEKRIPAAWIRSQTAVQSIEQANDGWLVRSQERGSTAATTAEQFDALLIATPAQQTKQLLAPIQERIPQLIPEQASSAIVAALAFSADHATAMRIPRGFGFLVPQRRSQNAPTDNPSLQARAQSALLACTFVDQKFSHRAPPGAVLLRAFFGGIHAPALLGEDDTTLASLAHSAVGHILGKLPEPLFTVIRKWPDSLPQYAVGHLNRIAELDAITRTLPRLRLIGNAYRGVGLPDLIHAGRTSAREIIAE